MAAGLNALAAIGKALMDADARKLSEWTTATTGAIGPSAPPGSVLHVGYFWYVYSERWAVESRSEVVVTATLELPGAPNALQSAKSVELFTYKDSNPEVANIKAGYVKHAPDLYAADKIAGTKSLDGVPLGRQLAILANSAIAALYTQSAEPK